MNDAHNCPTHERVALAAEARGHWPAAEKASSARYA